MNSISQVEPADLESAFMEPLGYLDFLCLMKHAQLVITDSKGRTLSDWLLSNADYDNYRPIDLPVLISYSSEFVQVKMRKRGIVVSRIILIFAVAACLLSASAGAMTYYIAANGDDSNNGTSKSTPWLHAPGMVGCTATCASITPQPGDRFILRGGDKWHASTGSPVGLTWAWKWSGSSENTIYIGVDNSWYSGASWARPIFDLDNPISSAEVAICAHDDAKFNALSVWGVDYVTFDNFEWRGLCWEGVPTYNDATYIVRNGNHIWIQNMWFHGWTHTSCPSRYCDTAYAVGGNYPAGIDNELVGNLWDGSDGDGKSMGAVYQDCYDTHNNVIRYMSNGPVCGIMHSFHDNVVEHINDSYDPTSHSNVLEINSGGEPAETNFIYNNVFRYNSAAVHIWTDTAKTDYFFNNVIYAASGQTGNCWDASGTPNTIDAYWINNTIVGPCTIRIVGNAGPSNPPAFNGTAHFWNNHLIKYAVLSDLISVDSTATVTLDASTNIFQSLASASSQGYTSNSSSTCANDATPCAPTSSTNATVDTATNQSATCVIAGSALCSGTTLGAKIIAGHTVVFATESPTNRRSTTGAWNAGAYSYRGSALSAPSTKPIAQVH